MCIRDRVYSGDLAGAALQRAVFLQIFWFFAMLACGKALEYRAMKKIVVQGGREMCIRDRNRAFD